MRSCACKTTRGSIQAILIWTIVIGMLHTHHVAIATSFSSADFDVPPIMDDQFLPPSFVNKRHYLRSVSEARLWWDDTNSLVVGNKEDLLDLRIYSTSSFNNGGEHESGNHMKNSIPNTITERFRLRLPTAFDDPFDVQSELQYATNNHKGFAVTEHSVFEFENRLSKTFGKSFKPQHLKTGTTIAGVCGFDHDGSPFVVLGADTRATAGRMVADKRCQKIHCLARNIWGCGAGTSADLDQVTRQCRYSLSLQSLAEAESIGNEPRQWLAKDDPDLSSTLETTATHGASIATVCRFLRDILYQGGGNIGANLIVGGVDESTGIPHIRAIHPHGSMDQLPYAALGSGGLAAMAVIESRFHPNITLQEGIQIVKEAILSGIHNDMGSGSQVDLCIITTTIPTNDEEASHNTFRVRSNYSRAVVPEEELPEHLPEQSKLAKEVDGQGDVRGDSRDELSTPGVNGFGNTPYSVRSKQIMFESRLKNKEERLKKWNELFGLIE